MKTQFLQIGLFLILFKIFCNANYRKPKVTSKIKRMKQRLELLEVRQNAENENRKVLELRQNEKIFQIEQILNATLKEVIERDENEINRQENSSKHNEILSIDVCRRLVKAFADEKKSNYKMRKYLAEQQAAIQENKQLTGPPGPAGEAGAPGLPGYDGVKGDKGWQGIPGYDGLGEKGQKGTIGSRGRPGLKGAPGPKGPNGLPGAMGSTGQPGYCGLDEMQAEKRQTETFGLRGSHALKGDRGLPGLPGLMGLQGQKGEPGLLEQRSNFE